MAEGEIVERHEKTASPLFRIEPGREKSGEEKRGFVASRLGSPMDPGATSWSVQFHDLCCLVSAVVVDLDPIAFANIVKGERIAIQVFDDRVGRDLDGLFAAHRVLDTDFLLLLVLVDELTGDVATRWDRFPDAEFVSGVGDGCFGQFFHRSQVGGIASQLH